MRPPEKQWEEQGLRSAVLAGNELAWRTLYDRHFDPLFAYVYARTRDPHRTEDLVQETWTTAVRRIASFDAARGPFGAWLRGIADRLLLNERRRWARRQRLQETNSEPASTTASVPTDASESVESALASLPEH
ncbi:MAG: RNA polymerase sigma factor, partial [FCB group bacterium]|nr:RNA polymerase sigma factor [FCB group bacterium]